jgi:glyoxylase-like metal-dependent hydrolase (beta-lactamase superfamily II)
VRLDDGDDIAVGSITLHVLHTPGHTEDSICLFTPGYLFSGDTLFVGKVGGTRFGDDACKEYDSLQKKLLTLPDETRVCPGHDYGVRPISTIGDEKRENPFLLQPDLEHFVSLKRNWLAYKAEHGIQ